MKNKLIVESANNKKQLKVTAGAVHNYVTQREKEGGLTLCYARALVTQSKSKTIITRSRCVISLIVFTDKYQGHVQTLYTKWFFITFKLYPNT